ncbi:MAG: hypothetical protein HY706_04695 [Candidatus Hydrogenedentes bacterium]|nr:hypothetical protein [Candidatus Hydrogenedentota bacterium]
MRSGCGSKTTNPQISVITQTGWRAVGAATIGFSALMAWYGPYWTLLRQSVFYFCLYWGTLVVLLIVSVYIAVLDMRYNYLRYTIARREAFRETLGSEEFRKALQQGQKHRENTKKAKLN